MFNTSQLGARYKQNILGCLLVDNRFWHLTNLFDVDDGYIHKESYKLDIMSFMQNLPGLEYHDIRIDYDTCNEHMAMITTTGTFARNLQDRISWQVINRLGV